ncbi:MAG: 4Fe-4S dicluster domain-containing protein [Gemmatimonadaceae bacterium]|nr:4Fe-4S dicluster domain-containing protein [Gemmatimonadaceae bacterium]
MSDPRFEREFPSDAAERPTIARRDFVKLLGASVALAGVNACVREPDRKILPYVNAPPDIVPGVTQHYATAMTIDGFATGLIVASREGRPIKIEGNPDHPASLGTAGVFEQASVLQLYDPHRASAPKAGKRAVGWDSALAAIDPSAIGTRVGARGAGLRLLLEPTSSPLIAAQLARVRERYPDARYYFYSPLGGAAQIAASRASFGASLLPQYDLTRTDVVVCLDADLLASGPFHLRHAYDFSTRRRAAPRGELLVAEPTPTPTGTLADRRIAVTSSAIGRLASALLSVVTHAPKAKTALPLAADERAWMETAAASLARAGPRALVIAGPRQPFEVHMLVHALNSALGSMGNSVWYTASPIVEAGEPSHDLAALVQELDAGDVDTLVILEGNPCYTAPASLELARHVRAVRNSLYLGMYDDETASASKVLIPAAHYLEAWGDTRAYDGTESIVQPLIAPLYAGRTVTELLAALVGSTAEPAYELTRDAWRARGRDSTSGDDAWSGAVRRGVVEGTASPRVTPMVRGDAVLAAQHAIAAAASREGSGGLELTITPSHAVYDGRFADNAWLQELPQPVTTLTWDNAALVSRDTAAHAGVESGDVVELRSAGGALQMPVLIVPGHANNAIVLAMGYGRAGAEAIARGVGVNANVLRTPAAPHQVGSVQMHPVGRRATLALTQTHWQIDARAPSVLGAPESGPPQSVTRNKRRPLTLYEPPAAPSTGFGADQWAMTIDLDQCTGCGACVVACQAENNIPVVGKEGVLKSREMQWMRIDRYVDGPSDSPTFETQPMLCQQCEKAPCEYVCPVNATVHSDDGINEMVYNRCVGTRFCSNNCPYKVRRFNWFDYNDNVTPVEQLLKNPEVTVRARGVMEKCTFCVQRVRHAQIEAELAGAPHTGPVQTACQQTCPSQAIIFGSLTAPDSEVARSSNDPRAFSALEELGAQPRVRYLRRRRT